MRPQGPPTDPAVPAVEPTGPQSPPDASPTSPRFLLPAGFEPYWPTGAPRHALKARVPLELYDWMDDYAETMRVTKNDQVCRALQEFREKYTA